MNKLTGGAARRVKRTISCHENAEGMASVGVRVERTVRFLVVLRMLLVRLVFSSNHRTALFAY